VIRCTDEADALAFDKMSRRTNGVGNTGCEMKKVQTVEKFTRFDDSIEYACPLGVTNTPVLLERGS